MKSQLFSESLEKFEYLNSELEKGFKGSSAKRNIVISELGIKLYNKLMIKNLGKLIFRHSQPITIQQFGSHKPIPEHLSKVSQTTIRIHVKNSTGQWQQIHGFVGEPLLYAIQRMGVRGLQPDHCHGSDKVYPAHERPHDPFSIGPHCGNCRVKFNNNWYARVMEETDGMIDQEEYVLLAHTDPQQNTRLSCCVPVQSWMNGMEIEILPHMEHGGTDADNIF